MHTSFAAQGAASQLAPLRLAPAMGLALVLPLCLPLALLPRGDHTLVPTAVHAQSRIPSDGESLLGIDAARQYYLNRRPIPNETLGAQLAAILADSAADRVLLVMSHRDLDYGVIAEALEIARVSGVRIARLVTEVPQGSDR